MQRLSTAYLASQAASLQLSGEEIGCKATEIYSFMLYS